MSSLARSLVFAIPGDLDTRTGGYEYDRRLREGLTQRGWAVDVCALDASFPLPAPAALTAADAALAGIPDGRLVLIDGLALGAMPDQAARHAGRLRLLALVHHPLALETGLDAGTAARLRDSERRALASSRHVVVTSPATVGILADFGVAADRVTVVEPGTDTAPAARGSGGGAIHLVCVASLSPRKGHAILLRALGDLRDHAWTLTCVGDDRRDPETARGLRQLIRDLGIADRVTLAGEADRAAVDACLDAADVFVLPTYYEGYGMAVAEALARGLPVISTPTGAIGTLVTPDLGRLVAPGDVQGWRAALGEMFDPAVRTQLTRGARAGRARLRGWDRAAADMERVLVRHG